MYQVDEKTGLILDERGLPISLEAARKLQASVTKHLSLTRDERELILRRLLDGMGPMRDQIDLEAYL